LSGFFIDSPLSSHKRKPKTLTYIKPFHAFFKEQFKSRPDAGRDYTLQDLHIDNG